MALLAGIQHCSGRGEACTPLNVLPLKSPPQPVKAQPGCHAKPSTAGRAGVCVELWVRDVASPLCARSVTHKQGQQFRDLQGCCEKDLPEAGDLRQNNKTAGERDAQLFYGRKIGTAQPRIQTFALPTHIHLLPNQQMELGSVPRPPPPSRHTRQGCKAKMVLSPGPRQSHLAQESHLLRLWSDRQVGPLPPGLLQLVERVHGVITGRAKAEDLVVLLPSRLPAFSAAVRHLERGAQRPALATAAGKGGPRPSCAPSLTL